MVNLSNPNSLAAISAQTPFSFLDTQAFGNFLGQLADKVYSFIKNYFSVPVPVPVPEPEPEPDSDSASFLLHLPSEDQINHPKVYIQSAESFVAIKSIDKECDELLAEIRQLAAQVGQEEQEEVRTKEVRWPNKVLAIIQSLFS